MRCEIDVPDDIITQAILNANIGSGIWSMGSRFPTAMALLDFWARPWSPRAVRFAAHRLTLLRGRGIEVL